MHIWLANLVAVAHGLVVVTVVIGAVMAITGVLRRHPRWELAFYAVLAGLIASELVLGRCFLTDWERALREAYHPGSAYRGSFVGHYCPVLLPLVRAGTGKALIIAALFAAPFWRWLDRRRDRFPATR